MGDIEEIQRVKYRYLRALDTKHWDEFSDTLTEDVIGDYGESLGEEHHFTDRASLVEFMRESMPSDMITEHRVTHPELDVDGDEATGIWYLQDKVIVPKYDFMLIGAGFYHDRYRRTADGWKISVTGYDRTYDASMSVAALNFKVKAGRAVQLRLLRDSDQRSGSQPLDELHHHRVVDRDAPCRRSSVGGVKEERAAVAWDTLLVDAHHHGVPVLRDLEILGATARVGVERALRLLANLHRVVGRALHVAVPPVVLPHLDVLKAAAGVGRGAEREVEREDAHRGEHLAVVGLGCHARRPDVRGYPGSDRLPACRRALVHVDLGIRSANSDNGNHLCRIAHLVGEPWNELGPRDRGGHEPRRRCAQQNHQSAHASIVNGRLAPGQVKV
jgi:hypothetical protein